MNRESKKEGFGWNGGERGWLKWMVEGRRGNFGAEKKAAEGTFS